MDPRDKLPRLGCFILVVRFAVYSDWLKISNTRNLSPVPGEHCLVRLKWRSTNFLLFSPSLLLLLAVLPKFYTLIGFGIGIENFILTSHLSTTTMKNNTKHKLAPPLLLVVLVPRTPRALSNVAEVNDPVLQNS